MAGTVNVTYQQFFSLSSIEPFFPKALEALMELAFRTNLHFTTIFHQLECQFNSDIHEGIELWVYWEDERFAAIYYRMASPGQWTVMARDYQFPQGQPDRQFPWTTKEEGVAILATFLAPIVSCHQRFLGQRHQTLQELKRLRQKATAA